MSDWSSFPMAAPNVFHGMHGQTFAHLYPGNILIGNGMQVLAGERYTVIGDNNELHGEHIFVRGDSNSIHGSCGRLTGRDNYFVGTFPSLRMLGSGCSMIMTGDRTTFSGDLRWPPHDAG